MIGILLAVSKNGVVGRDGKLPWHIPEDLRYFKRLTLNHSVVMGRKTFDSIGTALPNRVNYVVTRDVTFSAKGVTVLTAVEDIRKIEGDVFIIGGAELVKQTIGFANCLYLTEVDQEVVGDTCVDIDLSKWKLVSRTPGKGTEDFTYTFAVYERDACGSD